MPAQKAPGLRQPGLPSRLDQSVARGPTVNQVIIAQLARCMIVSLSAQVAPTPQVHPLRRASNVQPAQRVHSVHRGPIGPISALQVITAHPTQSATQTSHASQAPMGRQRITPMLLASHWHRSAPLVPPATSARAGLSLRSVAQSGVTCLLPPLRWLTKATQQLWGYLRTWPAVLAPQDTLAQSRV